MNRLTFATAIAVTSLAVSALAHSGASGVVKKRMDGMAAMAKALKSVAPMLRGQVVYDAAAVAAAADVLIAHSGDHMTMLFPKGSNAAPSEALDAIWEEWADFAALADALETSARGMKRAAVNGLASGSSGAAREMPVAAPSEDALAGMPVDVSFMAVARTCSACHEAFRAAGE